MPQLFAEPAAVAHIEWIPSVRASSGVTVERWARMLADGLFGIARSSPALRALAQRVVAGVDRRQHGWEAAIVRWARENIEAEASLAEPATATVARGRGNRAAVIVALARALGLDAELVLARPLTEVPGRAAPGRPGAGRLRARSWSASPAPSPSARRCSSTRAGNTPRSATCRPALDGARCLVACWGGWLEIGAQPQPGRPRRSHLDAAPGAGRLGTGRGARDLARLARHRVGRPSTNGCAGDESKLRQDFEQRWLSHHFPGARLEQLAIEIDKRREGEAVPALFASPAPAWPPARATSCGWCPPSSAASPAAASPPRASGARRCWWAPTRRSTWRRRSTCRRRRTVLDAGREGTVADRPGRRCPALLRAAADPPRPGAAPAGARRAHPPADPAAAGAGRAGRLPDGGAPSSGGSIRSSRGRSGSVACAGREQPSADVRTAGKAT